MRPIVETPMQTRWQRMRVWVLPSAISLVVLAAVLGAVATVVFDVVTIRDSSNPGEFHQDQKVLVNTRGNPSHSDMVVFTRPGTDRDWVGRVLAVGGDSVSIAEGGLFLNGVPVREAYLTNDDPGPTLEPFIVPAGSVYVLTDDRRHDSMSAMGVLPLTQIRGTVSFGLWFG
ncbi:MAG: signal peptidase I [Acidimicrobiales bacterium]|nr:signal peptidase I [Acidimicrobiales bacterium]